MRRVVVCLALLAATPALHAAPRHEPAASPRQGASAPGPATGGPPHAWLFGTWTGGLFPVLDGMLAQDCRTQITAGFSKDVVGHAALLTPGLRTRVVETVRTTASGGADFRFSPDGKDSGFGCDGPDELHVQRDGPNTISFPGCAAFPYKLERCAT